MTNVSSAAIFSKVPLSQKLRLTGWNYAHVLKNAGVGYGDYVEQITYLLFLKLADKRKMGAEVEAGATAIDHLEAELGRQITHSNRLRQCFRPHGIGKEFRQMNFQILPDTSSSRCWQEASKPCVGLNLKLMRRGRLTLGVRSFASRYFHILPDSGGFAWSELSRKVTAASRRSLHASSQRRDASATFSLSCLTN